MILNRFPWESRTGCQKSDLKLISDCILLLLSDGAGDFGFDFDAGHGRAPRVGSENKYLDASLDPFCCQEDC
jgi:hypothetical protein